MSELKDSVGNIVCPGAIIRMFHFQTNKKKFYMYKRYIGIDEYGSLRFEHLDMFLKFESHYFSISRDYFENNTPSVVVQCTCELHQKIDLKRSKLLRD